MIVSSRLAALFGKRHRVRRIALTVAPGDAPSAMSQLDEYGVGDDAYRYPTFTDDGVSGGDRYGDDGLDLAKDLRGLDLDEGDAPATTRTPRRRRRTRVRTAASTILNAWCSASPRASGSATLATTPSPRRARCTTWCGRDRKRCGCIGLALGDQMVLECYLTGSRQRLRPRFCAVQERGGGGDPRARRRRQSGDKLRRLQPPAQGHGPRPRAVAAAHRRQDVPSVAGRRPGRA